MIGAGEAYTDGIYLSSLDNFKPTVSIILIIRGTGEGSSDTSMDIRVVLQKSFHRRMVEVSSMVNRGDLAWGATEDLGFPGVAVEM